MERMRSERDFIGKCVKKWYKFGIANPEERRNTFTNRV
jgi:hypothetical protein